LPYLKMAAVADERTGGLSLFLLNRDLERPMEVGVAARGFDGLAVAEALQLHHPDLQAANTRDAPERIRPAPLDVAVDGTRIDLTLPPASWAVVSLAPPS
jgi:alpha-N-arabinofuranosidase